MRLEVKIIGVQWKATNCCGLPVNAGFAGARGSADSKARFTLRTRRRHRAQFFITFNIKTLDADNGIEGKQGAVAAAVPARRGFLSDYPD